MKVGQITPEGMARIYYDRLHFQSVQAVIKILSNCETGSVTYTYWDAVFTSLQTRIPVRNQKAAMNAAYSEGEVHV